MAQVASINAVAEDSPRSTIVVGAVAGDMTTTVLPVAGMNETNMASDSVDVPSKVPAPSKAHEDAGVTLKRDPASQDTEKGGAVGVADKKAQESPPTPSQEYSYLQAAVYPNLTPQQGSGYYPGYASQQTPEPASPAPQPTVYDVNSFFQHQNQAGAFHPASATAGSTFLGGGNSVTLSPARGPMPTVGIATSMSSIPPSPLFPRVSSGAGLDAQRAPNLPYMSPQLSSYPSAGVSSQSQSQSSDDGTGTWGGNGERYVADCAHMSFGSFLFLTDGFLSDTSTLFRLYNHFPSFFAVRALKPK